jgi:GSH-dependent disulfide-bond oxidoreductase
MIELYTWGTPNGHKASIMLEECRLPYELVPINIGSGAQNDLAFRAINPNGKIPAIVDHEDSERVTIIESGAILVYLAEKAGCLLPSQGQTRADALAWTFWQVGGLGPMVGQWLHFLRAAPEPNRYAIDRYAKEVDRLLHVLELRLATADYLAGDYSIADIANFTWGRAAIRFAEADKQGSASEFPAIRRWISAIEARPAVMAGLAVP